MVNSYFYQLVLGQLVLFHWSTRTFLQLVLWSTRTFSSVNSYFSLVNSYFFFGQLVLLGKKILTICFVLRACGLITGLGPVTNPSSQYED